MKYGFSEKQLKEIIDILSSYKEIEKAILFGSRSIDTYREASDVDIAIKGKNADLLLAAKLKDHFEDETYLPFFFDIISYNSITSDELKEHINTKGKILFTKGRSEWKEYKLASFADINPTERLPKGTIAKKIAMEVVQSFTKKIPMYSNQEYKGGVKFKNGDTIMARITPSLENGKTSYVDVLDEGEIGFGSTEFIVFREKKDVSDKNFVYYLAISPIVRNTAIKSMTGSSGRQRVQTDVVKEHLFNAPPLPEQKAIAEVLSSLDDKIDLLHRQNKTLEEMAETLFRQWFIEEAKEDWEEGTIADLAEHFKQSIKPQQNVRTLFNHYSIPSFDNGKEPVKEIGKEIKSNKYEIPVNCILFSKLNPHKDKRVWLLQDNLPDNPICSTEFQIVYPRNENSLYFLYGWLTINENYREIASGVGGTSGSHQRISPSEIFNFKCPIIPEKQMHEYSLEVGPIYKKQFNNQTQIRTLEKMRDILLPKLMSGEVNVET